MGRAGLCSEAAWGPFQEIEISLYLFFKSFLVTFWYLQWYPMTWKRHDLFVVCYYNYFQPFSEGTKHGGKNHVSWEPLKTNIPDFNPITNTCKMCLNEKFQILFKPDSATLNSRSEILSACRHKRSLLLVPPDPKSKGGWVKVINSLY